MDVLTSVVGLDMHNQFTSCISSDSNKMDKLNKSNSRVKDAC